MGWNFIERRLTLRTFALIVALFCVPNSIYAIGQISYVEFSSRSGAFPLVASRLAAPIFADASDFPGVIRAAGDLQADIERVSGIQPTLFTKSEAMPRIVVIVGTVGKSRTIDGLVSSGKLNVDTVRDHWEAFTVQVINDPMPGVKQALVIAGSDKRGTIYGIYDLSEQIGVSPWYYFADVPPQKHSEIFIKADTNIHDEPKVKYRGIFINDEAPAFDGWAKATFGGINHKAYEKVFELILRMKGNFLWPAMWNNAFYDDDHESPRLADEYGIVISTSHHEPMMRAQQEWKRYGKGEWNYEKNGEFLREFWKEGVSRGKDYERIITLGMRGDGDAPMSREANTALLENIVADQRKIIANNVNPDLTKVPQVWALYKEVQEYYEKGMRVPDDVTLLWSDDNWGNIRRLPTADERKRSGGAGVYYHIEYVGAPRNYKWLNTVPISKIREQMSLAYNYRATKIWIANVGDIKPLEFPAEFFLDYAWNPERWNADNLDEYARLWATREFGPEHAAEIAEIVAKYTKYNYRRKPELLEPNTFSLVNYREAETVVEDFNKLVERAETINKALPPDKRDAFFELVLYPVKACADLNEMYVTVGKNRLYAMQGRPSANDLANRARELFHKDAELSRYYNETLAGGKWAHMMDQTHIGYTYWNEPAANVMPGVQEIQIPKEGQLAVAVEGSEASYPGSRLEGSPAAKIVLPIQNVYDNQPRYFEVFDRGSDPLSYTVEAKDPWLRLSKTSGTVGPDQRIWVGVDWDTVPIGTANGSIVITASTGQHLTVVVPITALSGPHPDEVKGFIDAPGYVSIEAEHYTNAVAPGGFKWHILPDFGRTLSGVAYDRPPGLPMTQFNETAPRLEYRMYIQKPGAISVDSIFAPTQNFQPGEGLRYGISFDDEPPQIINFHAGYDRAAWEMSVRDAVRTITTNHVLAAEGYHTLKFWAVDPGLVIEKFIVNTGGLKPSYLGPPESFHR